MESSVLNRIGQCMYNVRKFWVMLDTDLAELYGIKTKVLNQAVRRNLKRFPSDFTFQLNWEEVRELSKKATEEVESQNVKVLHSRLKTVTLNDEECGRDNYIKRQEILAGKQDADRSRSKILTLDDQEELFLKTKRGQNRKYLPNAFTELGVAMLGSVLNTDCAIEMNISIMRVFVSLRQEKVDETTNLSNQLNLLRQDFEHGIENQTKILKESFQQYFSLRSEGKVEQKLLSTHVPSTSKMSQEVEVIQETVAEYYKIDFPSLKSSGRSNTVAFPKQVAMYLIRNATHLSFNDIAIYFNRDHTTVMHACKVVETAIKERPEFEDEIENIQNLLRSKINATDFH